jgi:hypothetical protein
MSVDFVDFCRLSMRSTALQPLPCSSHGSRFRSDGSTVPRRVSRFPAGWPHSECVVRLIKGADVCWITLPTIATLLRIPPRVNDFLWTVLWTLVAGFAPRSAQGGVVCKRQSSCGTAANPTRPSQAPSVHCFLRGPQDPVTPGNQWGKCRGRSKLGRNSRSIRIT